MPEIFDSKPPPHRPVMLSEVLHVLQPKAGEVFVDCTFGAGGYTRAILDTNDCKVIALDRDPAAIAGGQTLLGTYGKRLALVHSTFADMKDAVTQQGLSHVDGVVLDVGVSSMQFDQVQRGFSFQRNGPLDMRMSSAGTSAADMVNTLEQGELSRVIFILGDEPRARAIAREIVRTRDEKPLETTFDLVKAIENATGPQRAKDRIHPATKTFQALRILVNHELSQLGLALASAEMVLRTGGRLVVVTFHSLEDRIVKRFFTVRSGKSPSNSRHQPAQTQRSAPTFELPFRGHLVASDNEVALNPRARSAKLRAGIRTGGVAGEVDLMSIGVPELGTEMTA